MTLGDIKKKTYSLIEEIDTTETSLTKDPDLATKMNYVVNQIQYELSRIKKIPKYKEITVDIDTKDIYNFSDIKGTDSNEIYQLKSTKGIDNELKADGTIVKCLESGTLEVEYYNYPIRIDDTTADTYQFELSDDVLECMPYGVAADLLKSDVSNAYGNIYANRYEQMKQQLDIRYNTGSVVIGDGFNG